MVAGSELEVVHGVRPPGGEGLPLGRGRLVVDRQRVVRVVEAADLRVHLGRFVALLDRRDGQQHVGVRHRPRHRFLPKLVAPHCRGQQRILGVQPVHGQQLLVRQVAAAAVGVRRHGAVRRQAVVPAAGRPGR